jgi:hypothetical protein
MILANLASDSNAPCVPIVARPPTLADLIHQEPRIMALARRAARIQRLDWREYEAIKRELKNLVGWHAREPRFRTPEAYDAGHRAVFGRASR